jgi:ribosome biogenesis GTPase
MHPLEGGGFVVDTPGLRDIGLWGLEPLEVIAAFPEFADLPRCRFDNCRHRGEPDCAVARAVDRGELARSRYDSFRRMLAEAELAARPWA